jgi:serine protease Do
MKRGSRLANAFHWHDGDSGKPGNALPAASGGVGAGGFALGSIAGVTSATVCLVARRRKLALTSEDPNMKASTRREVRMDRLSIQDLDSDVAKALDIKTLDGVLISDVQAGGPAAKAGLRRGDVVLSIEGKMVQSTGQLRNLVAASPVGKAVRVEFMRGGERKTISVTLDRLPEERGREPAGAVQPEDSLGIAVAPLEGGTRQKLSAPATLNGLVVTGVAAGSPAARAGLEEGDVIVEADKKPVSKPQDLAERFREAKGALALLVWRKQRTFYAVIKR